jgi:extradiol dioxygenase family protein
MAEVQSLSHSAICVHDLQEAEEFYCGLLGAHSHNGVNFITEDTIKGRSVHKSIVLEDFLIALALAGDFMPMPPDEQLRGAHGFRHAFTVSRARFEEIRRSLSQGHVAYEGPVAHPDKGPFGESIYFKDPSGNFLEILWRRDEAVVYDAPAVADGD